METKTFSDKVIEILRDYCDNMHNGNVKAASRALGLDADKGILYKWLNGRNSPRLDIIGPVLDRIGVELVVPWKKEPRIAAVAPMDPQTEAMMKKYKESLEAYAKVEAAWQKSADNAKAEVSVLKGVVNDLLDRLQGRAPASREPEKKVAFMGPNSFQN